MHPAADLNMIQIRYHYQTNRVTWL